MQARGFVWLGSLLLTMAVAGQEGRGASGEDERPRFSSGYEAYQAGDWEEALRRFSDLESQRPNDYELKLNLGSTLYRTQSYQEAVRRYDEAASSQDRELQAEALYNLGNVAYRQHDLPQAEQLYKSALELNSDDQDAKFNLEFVRREMENQPQEQDPSSEGSDDNEDRGSEQQDNSSATAPNDSDGPNDSDEDGLPDETERGGQNPTDPENPDSDGDGLRDGEEDANANGQVDAGETDPNLADTDGDGRNDFEEDREGTSSQPQAPASTPERMTEEEAQRYLQALEDEKPREERRATGRRRQPKDW